MSTQYTRVARVWHIGVKKISEDIITLFLIKIFTFHKYSIIFHTVLYIACENTRVYFLNKSTVNTWLYTLLFAVTSYVSTEQCSSKKTHNQVIHRFICGFMHFVEDTNKRDVRAFTNHFAPLCGKWFVNERTSPLFVSSTKCTKPQINL